MQVNPPGGTPWPETIPWERIIRVCFQAGDWRGADAVYIFTDARPESYAIPIDAGSGQALWAEILGQELFDAGLAIEAAMATNELFC